MIPQVRRYDENGGFVVAMGRAGRGPGEFTQVVAFMRTAAGELLHEFSVGFAPVAGAVSIEDGILVFSSFAVTPHPEVVPGWMHRVDMNSRTIVEAHPAPQLPIEYGSAAITVAGPQPRSYGGSVFAAVSVLDTVWTWNARDLGGGPAARGVPSESIRANPPPPEGDLAAFRGWMEESWFLGDFARLPDGRWLYQAWAWRGGESHGRLLLTTDTGELLWDVEGNFRILDVDDEGRVYLWDNAGDDPAEVLVS